MHDDGLYRKLGLQSPFTFKSSLLKVCSSPLQFTDSVFMFSREYSDHYDPRSYLLKTQMQGGISVLTEMTVIPACSGMLSGLSFVVFLLNEWY